MGDPRKLRKKYSVPRTLWDNERIEEESNLLKEYGLKNVKELWIAKEQLRKIRRQARSLLGLGEKGQREFEALARRVENIGYGKSKAIEDLLGLEVKVVLERRLQSLVLRKGLAKSMKQARQLVTHGFIAVDGKKVSTPGYLVPVDMENKINYYKPIDISSAEDKEKRIKNVSKEIKEDTGDIEAEFESLEEDEEDEEGKKSKVKGNEAAGEAEAS
jgi:small subunit ribosomal protein S4